ncbi:MAG: ATP-binding protein [Anaerolineae bacterium]
MLLLIIIASVALDGIFLLLTAPETHSTLWMNGVVIAAAILFLWLMRRGWVRGAAILLCIMIWVLTVYYVAISGGVKSPGYQFLYTYIAIGLLLFQGAGAFVMGAGNIIVTLVLYVLGSQDLLINIEPAPTLARLLTTNSMGILLVTSVMLVTSQGVKDALERASRGELRLEERNNELSRRDTIMEAISKSSTQLLRGKDWEKEIRDVLRLLASADGSDRGGIFRIFRDSSNRWRATVRYEWCGPNVPPQIDNPMFHNLDVERDGYLPFVSQMMKKIPSQLQIPYQPGEQRFGPSIAVGTRSTVHLAIMVRGELWGSLFFTMIREPKVWPESSVTALQIAADLLGAVIERREAEQALIDYNNELEDRVSARTKALLIANEDLRQLNQIKDEFVSNVSHELRTPITSLKIRYHLLEKQPDRLSAHLAVLRRETYRLEGIINDLLTLSRMDQGRILVTHDSINLTTLVTQLVEDRIPLAHEMGLQLTAEIPSESVSVNGDIGLLEQALSVLVTNAINYTPRGGRIIVRLVTADHADTVCVQVQDNGLGIVASEQSHLFSRFFRGTSGRNSGVVGTGLGLAIAREIVNRHDGQISVESDGIAGHGSVFTIKLPIATPPTAHADPNPGQPKPDINHQS